MRSSYLVSVAVVFALGFGCFSESSTDSTSCAPSATYGDECSALGPLSYTIVANGTAELDVGGLAQGKRTITLVDVSSQATDAGDIEPVVLLTTSEVTPDSCGNARVSIATGRPGTATLAFDDGVKQLVTVKALDRMEVKPFFDALAASLSSDMRRAKESPPGDFNEGPVSIASEGRLRLTVQCFAGTERLGGRAAKTSEATGGLKVTPYKGGSQDLVDLTATGTGTGHLKIAAGSTVKDLDFKIVPTSDVTAIRWYAQSEDADEPAGRPATLLIRGTDAAGHIVHGTRFTVLRESEKGDGDLVTYKYDRAQPAETLTAQLGNLQSKVVIHPSRAPDVRFKNSDDEFANCSFGRATNLGAFGSAFVALLTLGMVRRGRRNGSMPG